MSGREVSGVKCPGMKCRVTVWDIIVVIVSGAVCSSVAGFVTTVGVVSTFFSIQDLVHGLFE